MREISRLNHRFKQILNVIKAALSCLKSVRLSESNESDRQEMVRDPLKL